MMLHDEATARTIASEPFSHGSKCLDTGDILQVQFSSRASNSLGVDLFPALQWPSTKALL